MIPIKRRKTSLSVQQQRDGCMFPRLCIFIVDRRMGATRRSFLSQLARSKGFLVTDTYSSSVTHVVSENSSGDEVMAWLEKQGTGSLPPRSEIPGSMLLLDISWFTESMKAGRPVTIEPRHTLKVNPEPSREAVVMLMKSYACQRRTPLKHQNTLLTDALEILAQNAEFHENEGRSVAFRRAASVLKALPHRVLTMEDLRGVPCLGEHSQRVIKALTGVFGVGVKTAERWFREGLHKPEDLIQTRQPLNRAQQAGVQYYSDLQQAVSRAEAEFIEDIVKNAVNAVLPGAEAGHDVDFLITHPEEGREDGLMQKINRWLEEQEVLLYQKTSRNSYLERAEAPVRAVSNNMDRFERCFSIFKLHSSAAAKGWRAVRVDLVLFERELRRWAGQEKHMTLSSHALYDSIQVINICELKPKRRYSLSWDWSLFLHRSETLEERAQRLPFPVTKPHKHCFPSDGEAAVDAHLLQSDLLLLMDTPACNPVLAVSQDIRGNSNTVFDVNKADTTTTSSTFNTGKLVYVTST
ncbi:hypothetical protein DNTS_009040 [Danionella cerebrum]|uniref:DNA-directed DNA/RNA polymerase mu n=1 Tax=Danionella cerebrum TaxID=2873325 RepID=A0A553MQ83_9TELE|nr:hypothetical protein DNTS_009040 [Danionella translucida]